MIINLIRHGARTPSKNRPEIEKYFSNIQPGMLTTNGFSQMVVLGKLLRKLYIENKSKEFLNFFDHTKVHDQFLIISSPYPRAVESGIGYALGLFPEYVYKILDTNDRFQESNPIPPIIKDNVEEIKNLTDLYYNFIIENRERDILFHSRRCKFPDHIFKQETKDKNYKFLNDNEKKMIYDFYKIHFNNTLFNIKFEDFTDKMARSLYTTVRCLNFNFENKLIEFPDDMHQTLKKLFAHYLFIKRTDNDEITKITSSPFLEHLINFFDHKVQNINSKLDFYELDHFNYTDLKFVSYSGHDYNFVGLIKNLLHINTIIHYINNIDVYEKLMIIPFASSIDFHLIKDNEGKFFVKIYLNGEELFESLRSYKNDQEIQYDKYKGIPYKLFKKILRSRIFEGYHHCIHTKN